MMGSKQQQALQQNRHQTVIATPIGKLGVVFADGYVVKINFLSPRVSLVSPKNTKERSAIIEIKQYFRNPQCQFSLFFTKINGSLMQKKIWKLLQKIPSGKVKTYGELARKLITSPRVIGNACRANPLPIIIPCHRVVAANGLGGYGGSSTKNVRIKKWLLTHEATR